MRSESDFSWQKNLSWLGIIWTCQSPKRVLVTPAVTRAWLNFFTLTNKVSVPSIPWIGCGVTFRFWNDHLKNSNTLIKVLLWRFRTSRTQLRRSSHKPNYLKLKQYITLRTRSFCSLNDSGPSWLLTPTIGCSDLQVLLAMLQPSGTISRLG